MHVCPHVPAWLLGESLPWVLCYAGDGALSEPVGGSCYWTTEGPPAHILIIHAFMHRRSSITVELMKRVIPLEKKSVTQPHSREVGWTEQWCWFEELDTLARLFLKATWSNTAHELVRGMKCVLSEAEATYFLAIWEQSSGYIWCSSRITCLTTWCMNGAFIGRETYLQRKSWLGSQVFIKNYSMFNGGRGRGGGGGEHGDSTNSRLWHSSPFEGSVL